MTRVNVRRTLCAALVAGMLGVVPAAITVTAQESTPAAAESGMPVGFTSETLALALADSLPETPALLFLDRLTVDPGAVIPGDAEDVTLAFVLVEEGEVTITSQAPLQVTRAAALADAMAGEPTLPAMEDITVGEDVVIAAGDSIAFPPGVAIEMRNDADEPAVLLASLIVPAAGLIAE
jgi:hypothetical protein